MDEYEVIPTGMNADGDLDTHRINSYYFCNDGTCPCHDDPDLIADVNADYQAGLLSDEDATNITQGRTL